MRAKRLLMFSAWAASAATVHANGFYIPVQSAEATGRGNAWLATADNAAAVYYNAAGLTQLTSSDVVVGAYAIKLGIDAEIGGFKYENDASWALLPQIYAATPLNDRAVIGFGLNTPFGLSTDWGTTPFAPLADETELDYLTGWLVMGYKVSDSLSLGGGFNAHYADASFTKMAAFAGDFSRFEGNSEALGWTISARWQPVEEHAFGAVYRSSADFKLDGDADAIGGTPGESASLDLITPATAGVGYTWRPCAEWSVEANVEWVNWNELNTLYLSKASGDVPLAFEWNSNFIYSVGGTRHFDSGWSLSAGYNYIENSQPDPRFNPGVSDADRHWINVGLGREWESFKLNLAYQYAFSDRDVTGSPFGLADGSYESRFHGVMVNCQWRF